MKKLTPNQFYVLICKQEKISPGNQINQSLELRNLQIEGWITEKQEFTPKTLEVIKELEDIFLTQKTKVTKTVLGIDFFQQIETYVNIFPKGKLPSGRQARVTAKNLEGPFKWFFQQYPEYDWESILQATTYYVNEYERTNYKYMRTAQYFIRKQLSDKAWESELGNYCQMLKNKEENLDQNSSNYFSEKVV